jgi:uncharacterized damage-inducible protein DinB
MRSPVNLLQHYEQLISYDGWANLEVIKVFRGMEDLPATALKLLAHIIAAEHLWRARLLGVDSPFPVWPELSLEKCEEQARQLPALWRAYLADDASDLLDRAIAYTNSKGETYRSLVRDILTHVFLHSAYHRGQIAADVRQAGSVPAYTDFIHGVRQGLLE